MNDVFVANLNYYDHGMTKRCGCSIGYSLLLKEVISSTLTYLTHLLIYILKVLG